MRSSRRRRERRRWLIGVDERASGLLLFRRRASERVMPSVWELPWAEGESGAVAAALEARYGGRWRLGSPRATVRHSITYRDIEATVCPVRWVPPERPSRRWRRQTRAALGEIAVSSLVGKALAALGESSELAAFAAGEDEPTDELVVDLPEALGDEAAEDLEQPQ